MCVCVFSWNRSDSFFKILTIILDAADELVDVEVEFDYEAELGDELSIKTGDIVKDVKRMEGGWWEGILNGRRGVFPDNFVKVRRFETKNDLHFFYSFGCFFPLDRYRHLSKIYIFFVCCKGTKPYKNFFRFTYLLFFLMWGFYCLYLMN